MQQQRWIIGTHPECDLVVDNSAVSARHCQLEFDGSTFILTDLQSTNGTFVNGQRLDGPRPVQTGDDIRLGQSQPMPWPHSIAPEKPNRAAAPLIPNRAPPPQVVTIGRAADNDIVLDSPHVSSHHARMSLTADGIVLEDLGSTNGTSVGSVENKIRRATAQSGDTVFFGSAEYSVSELLARAGRDGSRPRTTRLSLLRKAPRRFLAAAGISATVAAGMLWLMIRGNAPHEPDPSPNPGSPSVVGATGSEAAEKSEADLSTPTPESGLSDEDKLVRALFAVVCTDAEHATPFRVGTAFAVDARRAVTTASVLSALGDLQQNGYPEAWLYCPATGQEISIESLHRHPEYLQAEQSAREARQRHDLLLDELELNPPEPDQLSTVREQIIAAQLEAFEALDRKTAFDVGVVRLARSVDHWFDGVSPEIELRPNLKLTVTGLTFDLEDPFFDPADAVRLTSMTCRVRQLPVAGGQSTPRLLATSTSLQHESAFMGCPALNAAGDVVAVYSRPTPPAPDSDADSTSDTFDAPLFARVYECLDTPY